MTSLLQLHDGTKLLRDGWSDEDVERLTGLNLPAILALRAEAAAAPARVWCNRTVRACRLAHLYKTPRRWDRSDRIVKAASLARS